MMLALGMFVFMRQTLPHQTMQRESDYRWPSNSRIGKRDAFLSDFYGFSHLSKICICGQLLAGKPTASGIGTVHVECAVYQKDGLFLITISIIVDGFQKQGICPLLVFAAVPLTSGKESNG